MNAMSNREDVIAEFGKNFSGKLLKPGDIGYKEARRIHNGLIYKRRGLSRPLPSMSAMPSKLTVKLTLFAHSGRPALRKPST